MFLPASHGMDSCRWGWLAGVCGKVAVAGTQPAETNMWAVLLSLTLGLL
jgi:hypothetical protein